MITGELGSAFPSTVIFSLLVSPKSRGLVITSSGDAGARGGEEVAVGVGVRETFGGRVFRATLAFQIPKVTTNPSEMPKRTAMITSFFMTYSKIQRSLIERGNKVKEKRLCGVYNPVGKM